MPPPQPETPSRHFFFILGLWMQSGAGAGQPATWRFSLENAQTAQRRGFSTVAELAAFLEAWMCDPPGGGSNQ